MHVVEKVMLGATLLAVALIGTGIAIPMITSCPMVSSQRAATTAEMTQVSLALNLHFEEYGRYPAVTENSLLMALLEGVNSRRISFYSMVEDSSPRGVLLDGWKHPFVFEMIENGFRIRSAGKDGVLQTKDDLVMELVGGRHAKQASQR